MFRCKSVTSWYVGRETSYELAQIDLAYCINFFSFGGV